MDETTRSLLKQVYKITMIVVTVSSIEGPPLVALGQCDAVGAIAPGAGRFLIEEVFAFPGTIG